MDIIEKATQQQQIGFGMKIRDTTHITKAARQMACILVVLTRTNWKKYNLC